MYRALRSGRVVRKANFPTVKIPEEHALLVQRLESTVRPSIFASLHVQMKQLCRVCAFCRSQERTLKMCLLDA